MQIGLWTRTLNTLDDLRIALIVKRYFVITIITNTIATSILKTGIEALN